MADEQARGNARPHASAEQVADLLEGLLAPAEAATVAAHLSECTLCGQLRADLVALSGLLQDTLSDPVMLAMPAAVAARLDAALAAESADRSSPTGTEPAAAIPLAPPRRLRTQRALTAVLAAAAMVAGVLVIGDVLGGAGGGGDSASSAEDAAGLESAAQPAEKRPDDAPESALAEGLDELTVQSFPDDARALLARGAARFSAADNGRRSAYDEGCSAQQLRAGDVVGQPGPVVLLSNRPATLVTSGPPVATVVEAYRCVGDTPARVARATLDLSR